MAVIAAIGIGVYLFTRMDNEIRRHAQQILADQFPQLNVSIGGARLVEGRGIAFYDLTISETSTTQLQNNLLVVDEIMLACDVKLTELAKGKLSIDRVMIKHPQLWVSRRANGRWNLESLWPLPRPGEKRPKVVIKDAQIAIRDERQPDLPPVMLRDVNLTIDPVNRLPRPGAEIQQVSYAASAGHNSSSNNEPAFEVHGTWGGTNLKRAKFQANIDPANKSFQISAEFEKLQFTPTLFAWVSAYAPGSLSQASFEGNLDGTVQVQHQFDSGQAPQFEANVQLTEGRFENPQLPRPLTKVSCQVQCNSAGAKVLEFRGSSGSAKIAMQFERHGWGATAPVALGMRMQNLPLDQQLYVALPEPLKKQWDKYKPTGIVGGELELTFDGARWRPVGTLRGYELAFESEKFRYRLNNGSGTLVYTPSEVNQPALLDLDLMGYGGGQPLKIVGQVVDPRPGARGWVEITGKNIKIEQRMIDAMPEKTRKVIESMHPTGHFHVQWHLERKQVGQLKPDTSLRMELADCKVEYEKFPYLLSGIHGLILAENKNWTFSDLSSSGSRKVQCQGHLRPKGSGNELFLEFAGQQIALDDGLKQALPESVRRAWDEIRPLGRVDLLATVTHETGFAKPSISATIRPNAETATVQPKFFPYLLEHVEGTFDYLDGQVVLREVRAQHGRTTVRTNGKGNFSTEGTWQFQLDGFSVDNLEVRRDLMVALPPKLQKLIESLKPTGGSFGLYNGTLLFSKSRDAITEIDSRWDVTLDCHQADLQVGLDLRNVFGSVRLKGANERGRCTTYGELAIESATFQDIQFTNIRGPLYADETSCRLGRWATETQGLPIRRMTAEVYGGDIVGDGWATFDGFPVYGAQLSLAGADLARMMTERFHSREPYKGKIAANINLTGRGRSLDNLVGDGDIQVTDADIYELPILVGLLKVLRSSVPDSTAFNQTDIDFRVQGRHIYLDQLDFLGDAVSLFGKGYMNFDQQLKLVFHGVVGRNDFRIPFVKNVVGQASQSIMQMYVDGTIANPEIHTQAFPGINNLIQQIQTDLDTSGVVEGTREAKRGFSLLPGWFRKQ